MTGVSRAFRFAGPVGRSVSRPVRSPSVPFARRPFARRLFARRPFARRPFAGVGRLTLQASGLPCRFWLTQLPALDLFSYVLLSCFRCYRELKDATNVTPSIRKDRTYRRCFRATGKYDLTGLTLRTKRGASHRASSALVLSSCRALELRSRARPKPHTTLQVFSLGIASVFCARLGTQNCTDHRAARPGVGLRGAKTAQGFDLRSFHLFTGRRGSRRYFGRDPPVRLDVDSNVISPFVT